MYIFIIYNFACSPLTQIIKVFFLTLFISSVSIMSFRTISLIVLLFSYYNSQLIWNVLVFSILSVLIIPTNTSSICLQVSNSFALYINFKLWGSLFSSMKNIWYFKSTSDSIALKKILKPPLVPGANRDSWLVSI